MHPFIIVGIGSSAGGLTEIQKIVSELPPLTGMAIVVIQHSNPAFKSNLQEILAAHSNNRVCEISHDMPITDNVVFVAPSGVGIEVREKFKVRPCEPNRSLNIDCLLRSIAETQGNRSAAVILSGLLSDGSEGVRLIKKAGGVTIAQSPETAKYDSMPQSAIDTGCVDFVLSPKEIADHLSRLEKP
jgi:two-component system CheB/CheR fusion protein